MILHAQEVEEMAKHFVKQMLPSGSIEGVDLDSPAYEDMAAEFRADNGYSADEWEQIDAGVRNLLKAIGQTGFGVLNG